MHDLTFTSSKAEKFLCDAIRHIDHIDIDTLIQSYREIGDAAAFAAAEKNGVVPNVTSGLSKDPETAKTLPAHWTDVYAETDRRISAYLAELDRVADALAEKDIPLVALKNSGITRGIYRVPGASPMGDIDVLVRRGDFYEAHGIMESLGYTLKFRNIHEEDDIDEAFAGGGSEYSMTLPSGDLLWFELQWRPIAGRWIQPEQEPKADDLVARAKKIEGSNVLLMSAEDNLLQVCLHTAKHSFVRAPGFRLHTDVDRIVTCEPIDWEVFVNRVQGLRVATASYFSLAMARSLLGTDVPDHVLTKLSPVGWKRRLIARWLDRVGIYNPDDRKWSNLGYMLFVAMLYDRPSDLWRSAFPSLDTMKMRYGNVTAVTLPFFHIRRLASLVLKRTGI